MIAPPQDPAGPPRATPPRPSLAVGHGPDGGPSREDPDRAALPAHPRPAANGDTERDADVALVRQVAAGDADALGILYDRYGAAAYGLARAIVREAADAEDVVAEAFAQLWRTADRYDPARGSVGAWVTMVTRARAQDVLRAARRRVRAVERPAADAAPALPTGVVPPPDGAVERGDVAAAVRAGMATLPPAQREAIELAFFGGLSHGEIAATLAQPLGTVKTRVRTGLRRLRDALRGLAIGPTGEEVA